MLTSYKSAYKTWIFAKHSAVPEAPVARLLDFVINPDTGIFEAIWVQTSDGLRLISPKDILEWTENEIIIGGENEIVKTKSFPSIQKVLKKEIPIINNQAYTEKTKDLLGNIVDFAFDTISPRILSITTKQGFWIFGSSRIISHQKITKITKSGVFIRETGIKIDPIKPAEKAVKKLKSRTENIQKRNKV